jgi:Protein of unknown function (DUF2569)
LALDEWGAKMADETIPQRVLQPSGIGGWLLLPALETLVTPFFLSKTAFDVAESLLTFEIPDPALKALIVVETIANLAFCLAWLYAFFLLCKRRAQYPPLFIILSVALLGFVILDLTVANVAFKVAIEPGDVRDLVRGIVSCAVWVPYMALSRRVRNTFVKLTYPHQMATAETNFLIDRLRRGISSYSSGSVVNWRG